MITNNNFHKFYKRIELQKSDYFFYAFLIIYTTLLLFLCSKLSIWVDEAFSLNTTGNGLYNVAKFSYYTEGQPPGYYIILALWRTLNNGIFFARLLSVIFTFLSAFILNKLLRLIFEKIYTKWTIILFLLNPFTVYVSLEIRLYSLIILLSISAIYLTYLIEYYNKQKHKFLFILIGILGTYTQYYFVFLIMSISAMLLISKGWRTFYNYCLLALPIAVIFLPNFYFIKDQYNMHQNFLFEYTFQHRIWEILATVKHYFVSALNLPFNKILFWPTIILVSALLINSIYKIYIANKKQKTKEFVFIVEIFISITVLLFIFILVYSSSNMIYGIRYLSISFPFFCILYSVFNIYSKLYNKLIYGIFASYFILILVTTYQSPFIKYEDNQSVANFVQLVKQPEEDILVHDKYLALTLSQICKQSNIPIIGLEINPDFSSIKEDLKDTFDLKKFLQRKKINSKTFLFITGNDLGWLEEKTLTNETIDCYIKKNYDVSIDTIFKGRNNDSNIRVRRLEEKIANLLKIND